MNSGNIDNISSQQEEQMIQDAYKRLLDGYLASNHRKKVEIIERAFKFAKAAHHGIRRRSGEPYILHPIAVATIANQEIGLGSTSICAALLHDVVEDTDFTIDDIESQFGNKIAHIVEGLTKISGGIFGSQASVQAENIRRLLLTMSDEIRIVLIKMADRLHNMRTLSSMPPAKQIKITGETLYIYAPLAYRLGLYAIKTELEDLSFKYEHPETYAQISEQIASTAESRKEVFERFSAPIRVRLDKLGLKYEFKQRVKSCYSIWKKMEAKHVSFDEIFDIYAARIVFECDNSEKEEKRLCWSIYTEITDLYRRHPDRTRDWLSSPKANGYKALHVTVMGPDAKWVEVQIRSRHMDDVDERGFAAHWRYKGVDAEEDKELTKLIESLEDILKSPEPNAIDMLDSINVNLYASEIGVFTPRGEMITLPKGASVLDLAFNLHTEIGTHCIAAKVNHRLVPYTHKLHTGDQVEVLTSQSQQPQLEWMGHVITAKGKTRLRAALRHNRRQIIDQGLETLTEFLNKNNFELNNETLTRVISLYGVANKDQLLFMIGNNDINLSQQILKAVRPSSPGLLKKFMNNLGGTKPKTDYENETDDAKTAIDTQKTYVLRTIEGKSNYKLSNCCHPIPGDDVLGIINKEGEVEVHKVDCPAAMALKAGYGSRIVSTIWEKDDRKFLVTLALDGIDRMGILQEIIYLISTSFAINLRRMNITATDGVFDCELDVLVDDASELTKLSKRMKNVKGVKSVTRVS